MLNYVLLDIDNTLLSFDEYVRQAMETGFQKYGLRSYEGWMYDVFLRHNARLWGEIEQGRLTLPELEQVRWNDIFRDLDIDFDGVVFEEYFKSELFHSAIVIDGAVELLEKLHKKYTLCVASNGPYDQQVNRLRLAGMLQYFTHLFISENIGFSKPSKAFFDVCLDTLQTEPDTVVIVGDSLSSDIVGGLQCGLHTCFYNPTGKPVPPEYGVDCVAATLQEIPEQLLLIEEKKDAVI